jgi:hypothetical protein
MRASGKTDRSPTVLACRLRLPRAINLTPDAPPCVALGSEVSTGSVPGPAENMKCCNQNTYGGPGLLERGRVEAILAEDASEVQFGQVLLRIKPLDSTASASYREARTGYPGAVAEAPPEQAACRQVHQAARGLPRLNHNRRGGPRTRPTVAEDVQCAATCLTSRERWTGLRLRRPAAVNHVVEQRRDQIADLCARFKVKRLELFGSAVRADFDARTSDLDFLVEFLPLGPGEYADAYFGLLEGLEDLFARRIDLVMPEAVKNVYFLEAINETREVLYAA